MSFYPGIGEAVAKRTILRNPEETWKQITDRVSSGNVGFVIGADNKVEEYKILQHLMEKRIIITSGRHLQHGDMFQTTKNLELHSNCSTSFTTFGLTYLLLNGSGVGRCYDDDMMLTNWDYMPNVLCVLGNDHKDFDYSLHQTPRDARHKYGDNAIWFKVPDSREGWAQAVEKLETLTFEKIHNDRLLILDFSDVRPKGTPINGMQNRPASGPVPLMNAFNRAMAIKGAGMAPWLQAMYIDHYFAESVLFGGVRRAARMSTKYWKDSTIFEYIQVKRPIEFIGLNVSQIQKLRDTGSYEGFLWTSNNSVCVDQEFWDLLKLPRKTARYKSELAAHARRVFEMITDCAYADGTGEPGLINVDQLVMNNAGMNKITAKNVFNSVRYRIQDSTELYLDHLLRRVRQKKYPYIVNPCGEIVLGVHGGFCVIADLAPYFADTKQEILEAVRATVRFLIRTNLMNSVYDEEVKRTNRIGISLTGVHEFAHKFFGYTFRDLINEQKSLDFWVFLQNMSDTAKAEAKRYSEALGVVVPHTVTTIKPAGTTSKLFGLTEGWHLPSMRFYVRWVQFRADAPELENFKKAGYPVKELKTYKNTTIVGFPTSLVLSDIMPADQVVIASEATPDEQYTWLRLGEKYWIGHNLGNQISYTLKYNPDLVSHADFVSMIQRNQPFVRACSVMPQEDATSYEYQPEQPVTLEDFIALRSKIKDIAEEIDKVHIDCSTGACPVDFKEKT